MSNTSDSPKTGCCDAAPKTDSCCCTGETMAFLLLRGWLAVRAIMTGIEKFGNYKLVSKPLIDPATGQPDASGAMADAAVKYYSTANYSGIPASLKGKFANEPMIPQFAMSAFDWLLGPALILTGVMLLVGLGTRLSLFLQGLIYIMLTVGLILIRKDDGVAWLGIHMALIAFALVLVKHNTFTILKKW